MVNWFQMQLRTASYASHLQMHSTYILAGISIQLIGGTSDIKVNFTCLTNACICK